MYESRSAGAKSAVNLIAEKIRRGESIKGVAVRNNPHDTRANSWGPTNHIKDAFTFRKWLVRVTFAQKSFVVSIKNTEASTLEEAVEMAAQRATLSHLMEGCPLGNLMSFDVTEDTPENRKSLGVAGDEENIEYGSQWRNAA